MIYLRLFVLFFCLLLNFTVNAVETPSDRIHETQQNLHEIHEENPPCVVVIFGATGDLTARKLVPALYNLANEGHLSESTVVVGYARRNYTNEVFRKQMGDAVDLYSRTKPKDEALWRTFADKIFYHQGTFEQDQAYEDLQQFLADIDARFGTQGNRIYYLATPPENFTTIIDKLKSHGLVYDACDTTKWSRVIIEKPFGTDLDSAIALQEFISKRLHESQAYRVDHYLGKEGVQNLMALRFENRLFEPIWNHQHIDNVQITLSEDIGIGTRGNFWEQTGAMRDLVQNHVMQLLAITAMEPPSEPNAKAIHDEKMKVLQAIRPIPFNEIDRFFIRGQYGTGVVKGNKVPGYRQEQDVSETSTVETYVAAKLFIDNERWQGVPFYIRAGKRLPKQTTEIVVTFKAKPDQAANVMFIRIQPNMGVFLKTLAKVPGLFSKSLKPVISGYTIESNFGLASPEAYEKLIYDSIHGDSSLFVQAEEQIAAWRLLTPVLQHWQKKTIANFPNYDAGTWGPDEADLLLHDQGHHWELLEK